MIDKLSPEARSWNMAQVRSKNTKPELQLRSMLHRAGYRFRIHYGSLPGKPDIALPKYKTVIQVHGCFWHRHPDCSYATTPATRTDFWEDKFRNTVVRDERNAEDLQAMGWKLLVVWECELRKEPAEVLNRIIGELKAADGG